MARREVPAYGNTSYSALAEAVKAQCEILEDDPAEVAERKANVAVLELFGDDSIAPQIRALVGSGETPRFSRQDLFEAWRRFLERMAARFPLVLVLEDIHWADEGLMDFVEHAADWAQGPIMLLALARPELFDVRPSWGAGKRNAVSISLDPLTPEEGAAMIDDLLSGGASDELRRRIVERSEGFPLYTEEIIRALIDDGALRATGAERWEEAKRLEDLELPRSIQGLIAARLDGLPEEEKGILQDAAVVGRVFWSGSVAHLSDRGVPEIADVLGRLRVKELILPHDPASFSDEREFSFRHVLIRDGAYDSLPKALRAAKHDAVARWLEEKAGDRADEIAESIATHHLQALRYLQELGETGKVRQELERNAYRWARAAAERTSNLWLYAEAVRWYREAVLLAEVAGAPLAARATLARDYLLTCWGPASLLEVRDAARAALDIYRSLGDEEWIGWALSQLATVTFHLGSFDEAESLARQAVERLEPLGDTEALSEALYTLGWYHWRGGRLDLAEAPLRRSIEVAGTVHAPVQLASAMNHLGLTVGHTGRLDEGLELVEESHRLAKESGDLELLMVVSTNLPDVLASMGHYARAEAILREALEVARRAGAQWDIAWIGGNLGDVLVDTGRLEEAERHMREAVELSEAFGDRPHTGMRLSTLAWVRLLRGDMEDAEALHRRGAALSRESPEPQGEGRIPMMEGMLSLARGRDEEVAQHLQRVTGSEVGFPSRWGSFVYPELVRALVRLGRPEEAVAYRTLSGLPSPIHAALGLMVEGLVASDPREAVRSLTSAADRLGDLGATIVLARCLLDLGQTLRRAGEDARPTLERVRDLLLESDALLFLPEVEAALAEA